MYHLVMLAISSDACLQAGKAIGFGIVVNTKHCSWGSKTARYLIDFKGKSDKML